MHSRRRHSSTAPNEQNLALPWLITGQILKASRYTLSKQEGNDEAKKSSHAIFPLKRTKCRIVAKQCEFVVYLGAACLPLNVVENQTTVGRQLMIRNAMGHPWRTSVNSAIKEIRYSRISTVATNNNFSHPPTQRMGPSDTGRKTGRRTPEFFSLLPWHPVINLM